MEGLNTKNYIVYKVRDMKKRTYEYVIYAGDKPVLNHYLTNNCFSSLNGYEIGDATIWN